MSWDDVKKPKDFKATDKQLRYAEILLDAVYGDVIYPIYSMSRREISRLIDETLDTAEHLGIEIDYRYNKW